MKIRVQRGMSAVEILMGSAIFAVIAIPILSALNTSREAEQVSRYQYLALLHARDEMYRSRFLIGVGAKFDSIKKNANSPVQGGVMDDLGTTFSADGANALPSYTEEQKRISLEVKYVDGVTAASQRQKLAQVTARWLNDPDGTTNPGERPTTVNLVFGVLKPPGAPFD